MDSTHPLTRLLLPPRRKVEHTCRDCPSVIDRRATFCDACRSHRLSVLASGVEAHRSA